MSMQESGPQFNPEPHRDIGTLINRFSELSWLLCTRVYDPIERFMFAPFSLARTYRERHPKIATAITVGAFVPPVLIGAGYGWANNELMYGLSAGSDTWIVECAIAKLWSRTHPSAT